MKYEPNSELKFTPIGRIKTSYKEKFGTPRQAHLAPSSKGVIILEKFVQPEQSLIDLEGFSHIWVLFYFHLNTNKSAKPKIHPPRLNGKTTGLFATRSPHRFNPIGMSVLKIEKIDGNKIHVSGVDLVDNTPILDIKPYIPGADSIPDAKSSWTENRPNQLLSVSFNDEVLQKIEDQRVKYPELKSMIKESIELDPRALCYKGSENRDQPYGNSYGFYLEEFNVIFQVENNSAKVIDLESR